MHHTQLGLHTGFSANMGCSKALSRMPCPQHLELFSNFYWGFEGEKKAQNETKWHGEGRSNLHWAKWGGGAVLWALTGPGPHSLQAQGLDKEYGFMSWGSFTGYLKLYHGAVGVQSYNQQLSWCFVWGIWAAALKLGFMLRTDIKPLRVGDQQTLNYPVVLWAPAPRAVLSTKQCSKSLFVPSTSCWAVWWDLQQAEVCKRCEHGDSKRTVLQLAQGVQSNFYQNENKSWLLQHFTPKKQANMPSLSAGTRAALGKQWVVHTGICWAILKGTT